MAAQTPEELNAQLLAHAAERQGGNLPRVILMRRHAPSGGLDHGSRRPLRGT